MCLKRAMRLRRIFFNENLVQVAQEPAKQNIPIQRTKQFKERKPKSLKCSKALDHRLDDPVEANLANHKETQGI